MAARRTQSRELALNFSSSTLGAVGHKKVWNYRYLSNNRWCSDSQKRNTSYDEVARKRRASHEFFETVLRSSATKRDAKTYLSRFKSLIQNKDGLDRQNKSVSQSFDRPEEHYNWRLHKAGVNLGSLYTYPTAIEESPVFIQKPPEPSNPQLEASDPLHLAIVKIRAPQLLGDEVLDGVALTLGQLASLGLLSVVVIDPDELDTGNEETGSVSARWRDQLSLQAVRVAAAIHKHSREGSRVVDQILAIDEARSENPYAVRVSEGYSIQLKKLLFAPLDSGTIPIITPVAYTAEAQVERVNADDVVLALVREFARQSLHPSHLQDDWTAAITDEIKHPVSLDRIIILDPLGGIPAKDGPNAAHIFVNLEQEYQDVYQELTENWERDLSASDTARSEVETEKGATLFGLSNPFSRVTEQEFMTPSLSKQHSSIAANYELFRSNKARRHIMNLDLAQQALALLPPTSSALLTTPIEAAGPAFQSDSSEITTGVRTRPKRNPLIHNLLTDKPMMSSSLPTARIHGSSFNCPSTIAPATFFKRGMPLTVIPDPRLEPWHPSKSAISPLRLESDPRIDLQRLVHLIEDSFGRPLDVDHYLSRISGHIAGVIIAGEYEGGAILTWELPPSDPSRPPVPYLDKFAVLRRSQGSGGVADIVFNAMVRSCFHDGVVWRSRINNPVNKWYFERAVGTWKLPGSSWCMFWTGDGLDFGKTLQGKQNDLQAREEMRRRWRDYVEVCSGIEASWADREKAPD